MHGRSCIGLISIVMSLLLITGCAGSRTSCQGGCCRNAQSTRRTAKRSEVDQKTDEDREKPKYVQKNCPVTGEKLSSMGSPIPVTVEGRTIQVCCKACVSAVQKNPETYLKIVDDELDESNRVQAAAAQRERSRNRTTFSANEAEEASGHHH